MNTKKDEEQNWAVFCGTRMLTEPDRLEVAREQAFELHEMHGWSLLVRPVHSSAISLLHEPTVSDRIMKADSFAALTKITDDLLESYCQGEAAQNEVYDQTAVRVLDEYPLLAMYMRLAAKRWGKLLDKELDIVYGQKMKTISFLGRVKR